MTPFQKTFSWKQSKTLHKMNTLKNNCELFPQMYISFQSQSGDMDEFFRHENQCAPPSLSDMGELRYGSKCDLIVCLEKLGL